MAAVWKVPTPFALFDDDAIECRQHYGRIRREAEALGRMIDSEDLMLAAHALALDAVLATNKEAHFGRVAALRVVNWLNE